VFTGIIRGVGRIAAAVDAGGDRRVTVSHRGVGLPALNPGDSIAVNGVCLTAVACDSEQFAADVSLETLSVTTLGALAPGDGVNLEPALRVGDSLDGHLLTGHVDAIGKVLRMDPSARSTVVAFEVPPELSRYIARKGAVAVDGVSLTVNSADRTTFSVNIIPHTREMTVISGYKPGTAVNIEVDIIARYVERLAGGGDASAGVGLEFLEKYGFADKT
jgi:riboflavin synthase